jgi:hypothetical protein
LNDGPKAKSKCYQGETKDSDNKCKNISDFAAIGRLQDTNNNYDRSDEAFNEEEDGNEDNNHENNDEDAEETFCHNV